MLVVILISAFAYIIYKAEFVSRKTVKHDSRLDEIEREQREQRLEQNKLFTKQLEMEQEQMIMRRQLAEQAEELDKHAKQILALKYKYQKADRDIERYKDRISDLYRLLDIEEDHYATCASGSNEQNKSFKKIVTLKNQIASAEDNYEKAKHNKQVAHTELWAS